MKTSSLRSQLARQSSSTIWEPPAQPAAPSTPPVAIPCERAILDLLARPIGPDETHRAGNDRREAELLGLLDTLTAVEAIALGRRLANARRDDALVAALAERLAPERRIRVAAFVADTRRRLARRASR